MNSGRTLTELRTALLPFLLLALSAFAAPAGENGKTILRVYAWSEFFADEVLASFEEKYDCVIAIDNFYLNETMFENIRAPGATRYDLITPSSYMAQVMREKGMLTPLDHSLIPNLGNLDPDFLRLSEDPESRFSVPYTRTVTGVGYNTRLVPDMEPSWDVFGRADLAGRMTMLDDMRETIGAALKRLGHSLNTIDPDHLEQAGEQLLEWRKNLAMFEVDEGNLGLASGEYLAVHGYNGDIAVVMEENPEIDFFVPREGSIVTSDEFVIPANAASRELAHAFINHMLDVENAAVNMAAIMYFMPVPEAVAMLDPALRDNRAFAVPEEVLDRCEVVRNLGEAIALYERIWAMVRGE